MSGSRPHRRLLTSEERDLLKAPTIASQFPVVFQNNARFISLQGSCAGCNKPITPDRFRGTVTRPFPGVAVVRAIGACPECNLITPFSYRLHDDMRISGLTKDGRWAQWRLRPTKASRLRRVLRWLFGA